MATVIVVCVHRKDKFFLEDSEHKGRSIVEKKDKGK